MVKHAAKYMLICLLVFSMGGVMGYRHAKRLGIPTIDTIVTRDTLKVYLPQIVQRKEIGTSVSRIPVSKLVFLPTMQYPGKSDSVNVVLPIEQVVYQESNFRAVVEGYKPRLVEFEIYPTNTTIFQNNIQQKKGWNISVGPTICYGFTRNGLGVCVGFGATASYSF